MKKFLIPILLVVVSIQIFYFLFMRSSGPEGVTQLPPQNEKFNGKVLFEFKELEPNVLARSGDLVVLVSDLENTAPMRALRRRRNNVLFLLAYKQFVSEAKNPVKMLEFSIPSPNRSASSLLNQYGLKINNDVKIGFAKFPVDQGLVKVDGQLYRESELDVNNFIWASYDSEIFRYKLAAIQKKLREKALEAEAKKVGLTIRGYQEKYVDSKIVTTVSERALNAYMKKYNMENTQRKRENARNQIINERKYRGRNYILERFVMKLPIQVNIAEPRYILEEKAEWTPTKKNGDAMEMTLFSGTQDEESTRLLRALVKLTEKYNGVTLKYRPLFARSNESQRLTSQMHFCVLKQAPKVFWDYLLATLGPAGPKHEGVLYQAARKFEIPLAPLRECLVSKKFDQVVNYHLDYARYLGMQVGPVLYVGGEVLFGNIRTQDIEAVLQRKLKVPAAGIWRKP